MNYFLDGAIILIILLTIYVYYRRGFVKAILGVGKTLLSYICAAIFGKTFGNVLAEKYFNDKITELIYNTLSKHDVSGKAENIPSSLLMLIEKCGVDVDRVMSGISSCQDWKQEFASQAGLAVSSVVSVLLGYILVFIISYLVFLLGAFVLENLVELPLLRTVNRLLGLCLGILCAIVFAFLFVFIVKAIIYYVVAGGNRSAVLEMIDKTHLFKFFSELWIG